MGFNEDVCYNQHQGLEMIPYNIVAHLKENNDVIWNLLKYDTPDALDLPKLTNKEKANLIYNGQLEATDYRVFLQPSISDGFTKECAQLRVYVDGILPVDHIKSIVTVAFEVLSHSKINTLDNYSTRVITMTQSLIQTLNGATEITGLGDFFFNNQASRTNYSKQDLSNQKDYFGMTTYMSTWISSINQDRA